MWLDCFYGSATANGSTVHPPYPQMIHEWLWEKQWTHNNRSRETSRKTYPSVSLFTTNPTCIAPGPNPDLCGEKPATNRLSYGKVTGYLQPWRWRQYVPQKRSSKSSYKSAQRYYTNPRGVNAQKTDIYNIYRVSRINLNPPTTTERLFRIVTNSFPTAVAACCCGGYHVKLDTQF
jgi:hypothetical protein